MKLIPRPYQQKVADEIKIGKANLVIIPQRGGKSFIMDLIIDKVNPKKVLIITGFRKIVEQLTSYFPVRCTHILAGKSYDHTKTIVLASFQTLSNRLQEIDLSSFDMIIQDEYHSRRSNETDKIVNQPLTTRVYLSGTPLTNGNKLLTKNIDNFIQPITIREMIENDWLAPTRFLSNSTILGDNAKALSTNKQDFDESVVRQIIQKEHLLNNIVKLIDDNQLDTNHKTIVYVNYIATANELYELLANNTNVFVVHSKLPQKQQDESIAAYQAATSGVLINVRALSLGFDSPTTDTIIYALFTKIHSLCLQILWRASTIDPANSNKVATVYDMTGQLAFVNPYTDFKSYSKKLSCKDQCIKQYPTDLLAQYFCMESCKSNPILVPCTGKLPASLIDNPFIYNFTVHEGKPCGISRPVWEFTYKQTDGSFGLLTKWSKCSCGCVTSYDVKTLTEPSEMIPVYNDLKPFNTVTIVYSAEHHKALALFDDLSQPKYKVFLFDSSEELYAKACKFFNNKPFQIIANRPMPKLPNVAVERSLDDVMPAINWTGSNDNFVKHLIRAKLTELASFFGFKPGWVWFSVKGITRQNEKEVMTFITMNHITREDIIKFFKRINKN